MAVWNLAITNFAASPLVQPVAITLLLLALQLRKLAREEVGDGFDDQLKGYLIAIIRCNALIESALAFTVENCFQAG